MSNQTQGDELLMLFEKRVLIPFYARRLQELASRMKKDIKRKHNIKKSLVV